MVARRTLFVDDRFSIGRLASMLLAPIIFFSAVGRAEPATSESKSPGEMLRDSGVKGGLIVHLGCSDGKRTAAFHASDAFLVHGLDADAKKIAIAREHVESLDLQGPVSVEVWTEKRLPYNDNMVNLIVVEEGFPVAKPELMRVLAPGGKALVHQDQKWTIAEKPWPEDIDQWTHYLHGPDNNAVAKDARIHTPKHLQWQTDPKRTRDHDALASISAMTSSDGRLFTILDLGPTSRIHRPADWQLIARDAFNGKRLWSRQIDTWSTHLRYFRSGPVQLPRRLVSIGDRVYVTLGIDTPIEALDAATGKTICTFDHSANTEEFLCHDNRLLAVIGDPHEMNRYVKEVDNYWDFYLEGKPSTSNSIVAYDATTGKVQWRKTGRNLDRLVPLSLTASGDQAFYLDHENLHCLDLADGSERWRAPFPTTGLFLMNYTPTVVLYKDTVLCLGLDRLSVFRTKDGQPLWENKGYAGFASPGDLFVIDDLVWTFPGIQAIRTKPENVPGGGNKFLAFDVHTGEIRKTLVKADVWPGGHHHRCYRNKATERYLISGRRGVEFVDLCEGSQNTINWWVRGICQYGILPCNGLLYVPSHPCQCFNQIKFDGFHALSSSSSLDRIEPSMKTERLQRGPGFQFAINRPKKGKTPRSPDPDVAAKPRSWNPPVAGTTPEDWPTYRHDISRSGFTPTKVPARLNVTWKTDLGGKLSGPVIADGRLFVTAVDRQTVYCLDAKTGKQLWRFIASGRIDSPPTIDRGLAVFGCADGHVYALRADDGQLAWRFRAAPIDRRIVVRDRLESVWPIHGCVLIEKGIVYFAAGHTTYLDGGIRLFGLDVRSGSVLHSTTLHTEGKSLAGALPDVLISDANSINMRHLQFDMALNQQSSQPKTLTSTTGLLEDLWAHRLNWKLGPGRAPRSFRTTTPFGKLIVFNDEVAYGVQSYYTVLKHTQSMWPDTHTGHLHQKYARYTPEQFPIGNRIFAQENLAKSPTSAKEKRRKKPTAPPSKQVTGLRWSQNVPLQIRAMVLADEHLFLAGWTDSVGVVPGNFGPSAVQPEPKFLLRTLATGDGQQLAEFALDAKPVFDGMAAAQGHLYLVTADGKIRCLAD